MTVFPDTPSLGAALEAMDSQPVAEGVECVTASFVVISCLAQATRSSTTVYALEQALMFLGSVGIKPDADTMEYVVVQE